MSESVEIVRSLKAKVEDLIQRYGRMKQANLELEVRIQALQAERDELSRRLDLEKRNLDQKQNEIVELNQRVELLSKNAESLALADRRSAEMKATINELVKEIDNCITLLSK